MNRKERLRSEMGVDTPKKKKEAHTPIFYESETLAEQTRTDSKSDSSSTNRRTKRAKPQKKSGELNRNTNYRSNWQSEE